jgi:hypothetical protein
MASYPVVPATPPLQSAPIDGLKATYAVSKVGLACAASAHDVLTLTGSATKTIKITRVQISGTVATTANDSDVVLLKRKTANTGGTSSAPTITPYDSNSAAATATALAYTVDPTAGTLIGNIRAVSLYLPVTGSTGVPMLYSESFGDRPEQAVVLRGVNEVFAVNLNAANAASTALDITIEFTEE